MAKSNPAPNHEKLQALRAGWESGTTVLCETNYGDDHLFLIVQPINPATAKPSLIHYIVHEGEWRGRILVRSAPLNHLLATMQEEICRLEREKALETSPPYFVDPDYFVDLLNEASKAVFARQEERIALARAAGDQTTRNNLALTGFLVAHLLQNLSEDFKKGHFRQELDKLTALFMKRQGLRKN